ncbi:hypothetical protein OOK60_01525 [Trichothermofontia sichuanensis B231]|nr:hypothetical protein [Trichothermofontia sichuanensis]UZQ54790.1 hypothetical protein OOK60_01525 [Trichothermofontia sichuanensis B231]
MGIRSAILLNKDMTRSQALPSPYRLLPSFDYSIFDANEIRIGIDIVIAI